MSYDANGNTVSNTFGYDVENRMSGIYNGTSWLNYSYDAQNKRNFMWSGTLDAQGNPYGYSVVAYSPAGRSWLRIRFTRSTPGPRCRSAARCYRATSISVGGGWR